MSRLTLFAPRRRRQQPATCSLEHFEHGRMDEARAHSDAGLAAHREVGNHARKDAPAVVDRPPNLL